MKTIARTGVAAFCCSISAIIPASALEVNQAIENCRSTVGRPIVMACMRSGGGNLESCRASAGPKVRACVQSAMVASRPKAALFDAAKVSAPKPGDAVSDSPAAAARAPAIFVAPPRTISDIAAILDQQKPDAAKIAELTTMAEAPVPGGPKGLALADFYYKRAQARALLGRSDALADAELAVNNGQGSDYDNGGSRYEQTSDAAAARGRRTQACQCTAVQADGGVCQSVEGKAVRACNTRLLSAISETATPTRRKAMSPATARCWLRHSGGPCFRPMA